MNWTHCPLCMEPLEVREVSPCMDCGWDPGELEHLRAGRHTYAEYRVFVDLTLVLCDFCQVDFSFYAPAYFGLPGKRTPGLETWQFIRDVPPVPVKDKWCRSCRCRLAFLEFVVQAREKHGAG